MSAVHSKRTALFVVAALGGVACKGAPDLYPIRGGSGPTPGGINGPDSRLIVRDANGDGGTTTSDAHLDGDGSVVQTANGRVCMLTDMRNWESCATTGAGNIHVTIGTHTYTTSDDGTFTAPVVTVAGVYAKAVGTAIATSEVLLPKNNPVILVPAPTVATWATLQNSNSLAIPTGSGSIAMQFYYDNLPAAGVAVTTEPASATPPIYDSTSSATIWGTAQTSSAGVTIIAGLAESIGTQGVTVNETSNINDLAFGPISVFADSITFVGGPITAP